MKTSISTNSKVWALGILSTLVFAGAYLAPATATPAVAPTHVPSRIVLADVPVVADPVIVVGATNIVVVARRRAAIARASACTRDAVFAPRATPVVGVTVRGFCP